MAQQIANTLCPVCQRGWMRLRCQRTGGFSGGKAVAGAILLGPLGIAAGALGKKKEMYQCDYCGYTVEK